MKSLASASVRAMLTGAAMLAMALAFSLTLKQALLLGCVGGLAAGIIRLSVGGKNEGGVGQ